MIYDVSERGVQCNDELMKGAWVSVGARAWTDVFSQSKRAVLDEMWSVPRHGDDQSRESRTGP